jgi:hypothetical protein
MLLNLSVKGGIEDSVMVGLVKAFLHYWWYIVTGHRAGEAAIAYEHGADIEALMPKLRHSDYFTDPKVQELAAVERADPGYCRRVKDFVVGRKVKLMCLGLMESLLIGSKIVC